MLLKVKIANTFPKKLIGLMFKINIDYGLLIPNSKSNHTFNMRENIDVILLDSNFMVLMINRNVKKNKIINFYTKEKHPYILELPEGASKKIKVLDVIDINNLNI